MNAPATCKKMKANNITDCRFVPATRVLDQCLLHGFFETSDILMLKYILDTTPYLILLVLI